MYPDSDWFNPGCTAQIEYSEILYRNLSSTKTYIVQGNFPGISNCKIVYQ